ncbi:MAG: IgGFc-binding protein, partial [Firmicutes bacterium]|nr:IgGFc-binding protein [Bacillota bacterium]
MIKKRICINLFAIFLLNFFSTHAQNTEGTEFWLTFGKNLDRPPSGIQISIICGEHPTTGTIYFTNLGTSVNFNIEARSAYFYKLNDAEMEAALNMTTGITNYSVHITSNKPVTVYAMNRAIYSTDATNVLPVTALGTDYYQISYTPYDWYGWLFPDAYAVVGTKNNTKLYHNGVLAATLNKGQVYYRASGTDMTGARITADNPVAFFAVHQGVQIPVGWESGECLMQQLAPVNTWGKNYFVPVSHRQRDIVRIVASQNNTNITQAGGTLLNPMGGQASLTNLQAGQFVELEISLNNNGCYIQADKPIGVCTYLTGQEYSVGSAYSDPAQ